MNNCRVAISGFAWTQAHCRVGAEGDLVVAGDLVAAGVEAEEAAEEAEGGFPSGALRAMGRCTTGTYG